MLTTVLFGLAPALRATRVDLANGLKEDVPLRAGKGRPGGAQMLVALQIAVALLLTVGATLAVRSLANLRAIPLGFNAARVVTFGLDAGRNGYDEARSAALYSRLLEEMNRTPGVVAASGSTSTPMSGYSSNTSIVADSGQRGAPKVNGISERFLDLLQIPLVAGRGLEARDMNGARVAVVNESMARRYFGGGPAMGRSFHWTRKDGWDVQVVGIVKDPNTTGCGTTRRRQSTCHGRRCRGAQRGSWISRCARRATRTRQWRRSGDWFAMRTARYP
jgi:hypothetical protein